MKIEIEITGSPSLSLNTLLPRLKALGGLFGLSLPTSFWGELYADNEGNIVCDIRDAREEGDIRLATIKIHRL